MVEYIVVIRLWVEWIGGLVFLRLYEGMVWLSGWVRNGDDISFCIGSWWCL